MPRFDRFLDAVDKRAGFYIEIKDADPDRVVEEVMRRDLERDCFFWSGDPALVKHVRQIDIGLTTMARFKDISDLDDALGLGATILEVDYEQFDAGIVPRCHASGLALMVVYYGAEIEAFQHIIQSGADLINLDRVDVALEAEAALAA